MLKKKIVLSVIAITLLSSSLYAKKDEYEKELPKGLEKNQLLKESK